MRCGERGKVHAEQLETNRSSCASRMYTCCVALENVDAARRPSLASARARDLAKNMRRARAHLAHVRGLRGRCAKYPKRTYCYDMSRASRTHTRDVVNRHAHVDVVQALTRLIRLGILRFMLARIIHGGFRFYDRCRLWGPSVWLLACCGVSCCVCGCVCVWRRRTHRVG